MIKISIWLKVYGWYSEEAVFEILSGKYGIGWWHKDQRTGENLEPEIDYTLTFKAL